MITYKGEDVRATSLEINLENFKFNISEIQKYVGENVTLMPVIKANAYGTYINKQIDLINNYEIVAVAIAEEAKYLRENGYKGEILILNQPDISDIETILKYDISSGTSNIEFLKQLVLKGKRAKIHLELETGMGRTGIKLEENETICFKIKENPLIEVEGVYTHFAVADEDKEYTNLQIERFNRGLEIIKKYFPNIKYIHYSASNGILNADNTNCNTVRPGIIMYGYEPFEGAYKKINLKPVARLKSKINFVKKINKGDSVSYGRIFIAEKETIVATVPIGYADGIRRSMTGANVVVNGRLAKIIGKVCMDSFMIDVTDIPNVNVGDTVFIWDNENITLNDVAKKCNTINYEILSCISDRVPREFI
jgi:alanine racemase